VLGMEEVPLTRFPDEDRGLRDQQRTLNASRGAWTRGARGSMRDDVNNGGTGVPGSWYVPGPVLPPSPPSYDPTLVPSPFSPLAFLICGRSLAGWLVVVPMRLVVVRWYWGACDSVSGIRAAFPGCWERWGILSLVDEMGPK
jgi:hypothetical protein